MTHGGSASALCLLAKCGAVARAVVGASENDKLFFPVERQLHDFGGDLAVLYFDFYFQARLSVSAEYVAEPEVVPEAG